MRSLVGAEIKEENRESGEIFGFVLTFPQETLELRAHTADEQVEWIERLKYSIAEANKNKDGTKELDCFARSKSMERLGLGG